MKKIFILFAGILFIGLTVSAQQTSIGNYNVYYGTIHNHCGYSDGTGTPDEAYSYAKDSSDLDFFGLSDHAELLTSSEYAEIISTADDYDEDGVFTTFYGFEWTSVRYGHVSVFNTTDYKTSGWWFFYSFNTILKWVNNRDCFAFFNHPGDYDGFSSEFDHFEDTPSDNFVGIELWNGDNGFSDYYYNDGYFSSDGDLGYYDEALIRGWRIGAAGSEDNHDDDWGNKTDYKFAVLADNLTRDDLTNAIMERRFYSTLDKNLSMSFTVNGEEMGAEVDEGVLTMQILLNDGDNESFSNVELIQNGNVIKTWAIDEQEPTLTYSYSGTESDYFYIKCTQADGDEAISSPVFIVGDESESETKLLANADETEVESDSTFIEIYEESIIDEDVSEENLSFVIYPNPAEGESIQVKVSALSDDLRLQVIDVKGLIIADELLNDEQVTLPSLNSGVYFVRITNKSFTQTQTLLVK